MSARVVATTQLLIDVIANVSGDFVGDADSITPSELRFLQFFLPMMGTILAIKADARAEMGAAVALVLET